MRLFYFTFYLFASLTFSTQLWAAEDLIIKLLPPIESGSSEFKDIANAFTVEVSEGCKDFWKNYMKTIRFVKMLDGQIECGLEHKPGNFCVDKNIPISITIRHNKSDGNYRIDENVHEISISKLIEKGDYIIEFQVSLNEKVQNDQRDITTINIIDKSNTTVNNTSIQDILGPDSLLKELKKINIEMSSFRQSNEFEKAVDDIIEFSESDEFPPVESLNRWKRYEFNNEMIKDDIIKSTVTGRYILAYSLLYLIDYEKDADVMREVHENSKSIITLINDRWNIRAILLSTNTINKLQRLKILDEFSQKNGRSFSISATIESLQKSAFKSYLSEIDTVSTYYNVNSVKEKKDRAELIIDFFKRTDEQEFEEWFFREKKFENYSYLLKKLPRHRLNNYKPPNEDTELKWQGLHGYFVGVILKSFMNGMPKTDLFFRKYYDDPQRLCSFAKNNLKYRNSGNDNIIFDLNEICK